MKYGPITAFAEEIHKSKYRLGDESFEECMTRIASALQDGSEDFRAFRDILLSQRFLPGGRIQNVMGSPRRSCSHNCFVSRVIPDSMKGIMHAATEAAQTMALGGGIGYDFSTLRPEGDRISSTDSRSSGPLSFMNIFDAVCDTVESAGNRRGAQMGVLRIDHPDIEKFIHAKQGTGRLKKFNISIAVTDRFMACLDEGKPFPLVFKGRKVRDIDAGALWEQVMRSNWDWAEPGVLFIDRINEMNNLWYCERLAATNPCAEQPLPPYGACLLGSFNLAKYVDPVSFNYSLFIRDIAYVVRAMDNVVDRAVYPLPQQEEEAKNKRRMGLGVTGFANASEILGMAYGSSESLAFEREVLTVLRDQAYNTSINLAIEKGPFELFRADVYCQGRFIKTLPDSLQQQIANYGIRNSHLTSIAPTGTISLAADNVSSGIEPVFEKEYTREVIFPEGKRYETVMDYAYKAYGITPTPSSEVTAAQHVDVLCVAARLVDSSVSKTCNVDAGMSWEDFKNIYLAAYKGGAKGCTTFNLNGKLAGVLQTICTLNADGSKSCE
jgi:ribonucleoside-diphosphate reductase alpha chain